MGYPLCTNKRTRNGSEKRNKLGREFINYVGCIQCTTETTILVLFRYRNSNWPIISADTILCRNTRSLEGSFLGCQPCGSLKFKSNKQKQSEKIIKISPTVLSLLPLTTTKKVSAAAKAVFLLWQSYKWQEHPFYPSKSKAVGGASERSERGRSAFFKNPLFFR